MFFDILPAAAPRVLSRAGTVTRTLGALTSSATGHLPGGGVLPDPLGTILGTDPLATVVDPLLVEAHR